VERVRAATDTGRLEPPVVVVLEGRARDGAGAGTDRGVEVVHAAGVGDDTIAALAEAHPDATVVTADRALAARARAFGAVVVEPSWLLGRLSE
jgi:rRNA-processing protein FCF1